MKTSRMLLLELNEINFEVARFYVETFGLRHLAALMAETSRSTSSEAQYEQLEPWIQWVSAHSGLTAAEHNIFRLGDIVTSDVPQIFEQVEAQGLSVGAVSPMNTQNRLKHPAYFLPDPWTKTPSDGSFWSRSLSEALAQAVNDNSEGRITAKSALSLVLGVMRFAKPRHYPQYIKLALDSRGAPWRKALFLDLFLHDLHASLFRSKRPNFSTLFLNAGAHIQHHYFFNSQAVADATLQNPVWYAAPDVDPLAEMFKLYDTIIGEYLADRETNLIVATGLSQKPYDHVEFYYRLTDHAAFLKLIGVPFTQVLPRMTRDFLIEFASVTDARTASEQLSNMMVAKPGKPAAPLFAEIDNRGDSLFVTLTYPNEISDDLTVTGTPAAFKLSEHVVFVAVKNGMHAANGYAYFRGAISKFAPAEGAHIKSLHTTITQFFGMAARPTAAPTPAEVPAARV
jgi:hypothetical protein